jgi:hypothetical protein
MNTYICMRYGLSKNFVHDSDNFFVVRAFGIFYFQGPMLWFLKYFRKKISKNIGVFWLKLLQVFEKNDHKIGFWEKRQFFAENWQKWQKIGIITSTPDFFHKTEDRTGDESNIHSWARMSFIDLRKPTQPTEPENCKNQFFILSLHWKPIYNDA